MRLEDWRTLSADQIAACYRRDHERWTGELHWDLSATWSTIEDARQRGWLPGFAAVSDSGTLVGWTFFTPREGTLRIGALQARQAGVVRDLLEAVLTAPESATCQRYQCFLFPDDGSVEVALERRRFSVERYHYLEKTVNPSPPGAPEEGRAWNDADLPHVARALARGYAGTHAARFFAPNGRLEDWARYLGEIVNTPACGSFSPSDSVLLGDAAAAVDGLTLTTWLSPDTAHVAQLVVDPARRGRGLAKAMVEQVSRRVALRGAVRLTLLVAESNLRARHLYERLAFVHRATFVFASRDRITRGAVPALA